LRLEPSARTLFFIPRMFKGCPFTPVRASFLVPPLSGSARRTLLFPVFRQNHMMLLPLPRSNPPGVYPLPKMTNFPSVSISINPPPFLDPLIAQRTLMFFPFWNFFQEFPFLMCNLCDGEVLFPFFLFLTIGQLRVFPLAFWTS